MHVHHKVKEEHQNVKGIFIEIGTIIFAVLFALGVESWWEHHNTMKMVEVSMEKVNKEIENNIYEFAAVQKSSQVKFDNLITLENKIDNKAPFSSVVGKFDGYSAVSMQISSWKRVLNDRISTYFPPEYLEGTYDIYEAYEAFDLLRNNLLQFVFSDLFHNKEKEREAYEISKLYYIEMLRHCKARIKDHLEFIHKYDAENYANIKAKCDSILAIKQN